MCVLSWHCGVDVKKFGLLMGLGVALAVFAGSQAYALEEQKGTVVPPEAADAPKAAVQDGAAAVKPDTGTEIRIPGLGKLGTLPKMDFGLELLYGAADGKQPEDAAPVQNDPDSGNLTIRGSVKHNF
jgi:hypothetical protein